MSRRRATLADAMDGVRWDYDPARQILSPLVATARWFEDFPWGWEAGEPGEELPSRGEAFPSEGE